MSTPVATGEEEVSLLTIARGAAVEVFDRLMQDVLRNVADPATEAETTRKITIEIALHPNEDRTAMVTGVQGKAALAPLRQVPTTLYTTAHKKNGRYVAVEYDPKQSSLLRPQEKPEPLRAVAGSAVATAPPAGVDPGTGEVQE
jgi:hypothetical protein